MKSLTTLLMTVMIFGCAGGRPALLGITEGRLAPCPDSPNCVSSQAADSKHFIAPIRYEGPMSQAQDRILAVVRELKRSRVVTMKDSYVHVEFTSAFFRFVDDVEFYFDDATKTLHMRSASRLGHSDFGVNRKRMEDIRARWLGLKKAG